MKQTKNQIKENNQVLITKALESIKSLFTSEMKARPSVRKFVNPDGTIAESIDTYRQFRNDFNNRGYGC